MNEPVKKVAAWIPMTQHLMDELQADADAMLSGRGVERRPGESWPEAISRTYAEQIRLPRTMHEAVATIESLRAERDRLQQALTATLAAIEPLMNADAVWPYISAWEFDADIDGVHGERLYLALREAYSAAGGRLEGRQYQPDRGDQSAS